MKFARSRRFAAVLAVMGLSAAMPFQSVLASQSTPSSSSRVQENTQVRVNGVVPEIVSTRQARLLRTKPSSSIVGLSIDLRPRNESALNRFIQTKALKGHYMSQEQYDKRFGATHARSFEVKSWVRSHGFHITYVSRDRLTYGVRASAGNVEHVFALRLNQYRYGKRRFYAASSNPTVPTRLGIQTVVGLDNLVRPHTLGLRRADVRTGGYYPSDYRKAYDVSGHAISGSGQDIGLTLWGPQAPNSAFSALSSHQKSDTSVNDPVLKSCSGCSTANTLEWIHVDGTDTSTTEDLTETAMDAEYSHGMALNSHLRFYLAKNASQQDLTDAISKAANDSKIHVVSNSWGGGYATSTSDPFVQATTTSFKHAVAVGTTFYFAAGDNSENSGCSVNSKGLHNLCDQPIYPASNPYVVAVGGTNLQVTQNLSWSSETVWNSDPNNDFAGGGNGCTTVFSRPSWQTVVSTNATCTGRAFPDISADGDPETGATVWTNGSNNEAVGGTSLAAPLTAGMAALTNAYLAKQGKAHLGFAAPKIYALGKSSLYNTYFHDVRCGYNGVPAAPGWDQASGFGSLDWYRFAQGVAGQSVSPVTRTFKTCTAVSNTTQVSDPFNWDDPNAFVAWPVWIENEHQSTATAAQDDSSSNPMKRFHSSTYTSFGVKGSAVQSAVIDTQGDGSFSTKATLYYLGSYTKTNAQAAALAANARKHFASSSATNCLFKQDFPSAPVDCYFYGLINLPNSQVAYYTVAAEQNAVVEVLAIERAADMNGSVEQNLANGFSTVLESGTDRLNVETNSGSGEKYAPPPTFPGGVSTKQQAGFAQRNRG